MSSWTKPGGTIVVEDVDIPAAVCSPELAAFTRTIELMSDAMRRRGGDPTLGRRLAVLFHEAGFDEIETDVVQPGTLHGDAKLIQHLTLVNIRTTLLDLGLATSRRSTNSAPNSQTSWPAPTPMSPPHASSSAGVDVRAVQME